MARLTEKVRTSDSLLVNSRASEILKQAADSVGCTVQQLVDLVVDGGLLATPPQDPDGITCTLTLKDLGKRMQRELAEVNARERTEWFQELLEPQKVALVVALHDQGHRPELIALELGVPSTDIRSWIDAYADRVGAQVTQIRLTTIAGHVRMAAEKAMAGLERDGNWRGYWAVQKEVVSVLQSLGIVDQAIHRVEVTHKMEDTTKAEIEAMLEIERKRQRRLEEIKQVEGVVLDEVPQLAFEREA